MSSDLFSILKNGAQSLSAHRASTAVAGHNLQNSATPGFARQRAELVASAASSASGVGYIGRGVQFGGVTQARDRFIERQIPPALSNKARSSAEGDALMSVRALDPSEASALGNSLAGFYSSLRSLSQNPADAVIRRTVVEDARRLAGSFNRTGTSLEAARSALDDKLETTLNKANMLAEQAASLNVQIKTARTAGFGEPNDLLDARQRTIDELGTLIGGRPVPSGDGDISVVLQGGASVVSGSLALKLSTTVDASNRGHLALRITTADGGSPVSLANSAFGGEAGGTLAARDEALRAASDGIDQLAYDFGTAFNTQHRAGFALDGTDNHDFFTVGGLEGAASTFVINEDLVANPSLIAAAGSAGTLPGDAANLVLLVGTERSALSTGVNATATLSRITGDFGNAAARAEAMDEQDTTLLESLQEARESTSGVSIDEEVVNLTRAQRAFEATMKVITTADEMLDSLMKIR